MTAAKWWIVMLPGESPETSEAYGPLRAEASADAYAAAWNLRHADGDDRAFVLPVASPESLGGGEPR